MKFVVIIFLSIFFYGCSFFGDKKFLYLSSMDNLPNITLVKNNQDIFIKDNEQITLLAIFSIYDKKSKSQIYHLIDLQKHSQKAINIIALSADDISKADITKYIQEDKILQKSMYFSNETIKSIFDIKYDELPYIYLYDKRGEKRQIYKGFTPVEMIEYNINNLDK